MRSTLSLLSVMLLLLVAPAAVDAAASPPLRRVAVVVGANAAAPGRRPLRFAYNDAARVAEVLRLAGFADKDVHVLRDPEPAVLLRTLDDARRTLSGTAGETMLVFYYSGHADAASLYPDGQELAMAGLRERLDDPRVGVRIGIIDACRGGGWTGSKGVVPTEAFAVGPPLALSNEGSVLISSSSGLEDAHESEVLEGSFFTHHWNAALRGAGDRDGDGTITLAEAFGYAKELTVRDTALAAETPQHPSFQLNLRGRRDLPLVTMAAATSLVTVEQRIGPLQLVHLDSGLVVLEVPRGQRRIRLAVPPGRYLVRRSAASSTYASELTVVAGQETRLREEDLVLVGNPRLAVKGGGPTRRVTMGFGFGTGGLSGTESEDLSQGVAMAIHLGYRLRPQLRALVSGNYTMFARYQPDPDLMQQQSAITLGLRWAPFEFPLQHPDAMTADLTNIYLKAGLGVGHLIRQPYGSFNLFRTDQGSYGLAATAALGWNVIRGERFGFGLEASDSLVVYAHESRHNFGFGFMLEAELF